MERKFAMFSLACDWPVVDVICEVKLVRGTTGPSPPQTIKVARLRGRFCCWREGKVSEQ